MPPPPVDCNRRPIYCTVCPLLVPPGRRRAPLKGGARVASAAPPHPPPRRPRGPDGGGGSTGGAAPNSASPATLAAEAARRADASPRGAGTVNRPPRAGGSGWSPPPLTLPSPSHTRPHRRRCHHHASPWPVAARPPPPPPPPATLQRRPPGGTASEHQVIDEIAGGRHPPPHGPLEAPRHEALLEPDARVSPPPVTGAVLGPVLDVAVRGGGRQRATANRNGAVEHKGVVALAVRAGRRFELRKAQRGGGGEGGMWGRTRGNGGVRRREFGTAADRTAQETSS